MCICILYIIYNYVIVVHMYTNPTVTIIHWFSVSQAAGLQAATLQPRTCHCGVSTIGPFIDKQYIGDKQSFINQTCKARITGSCCIMLYTIQRLFE